MFELHGLEKAPSALLSGQWSGTCLIRGHFVWHGVIRGEFGLDLNLGTGQKQKPVFKTFHVNCRFRMGKGENVKLVCCVSACVLALMAVLSCMLGHAGGIVVFKGSTDIQLGLWTLDIDGNQSYDLG